MPVLTRSGFQRAIEDLVSSREDNRRRNFLAAIGREISNMVQEEMIDDIENYQLDISRRDSVESLIRRLLKDNDDVKSARLKLPFPKLAYVRLYGEDAMNNFVDEQSFQLTRIQQYVQGDAATRVKVYAEVVASKLIDREREFKRLTKRVEQAYQMYADKSKEAETLQEILPRCFCQQPLLADNFQITVLTCGHVFHEECITHNYRFYADTCPICHRAIRLTDMKAGYFSV